MASMNNTHIALVPKIKKRMKVTDFKPISLSNVTYKIVTKMLANRLRCVLEQIVSPSQRRSSRDG